MNPETGRRTLMRDVIRQIIYRRLSEMSAFLSLSPEDREGVVDVFNRKLLAKSGSEEHYTNLMTLRTRMNDIVNELAGIGTRPDPLYGVSSQSTGFEPTRSDTLRGAESFYSVSRHNSRNHDVVANVPVAPGGNAVHNPATVIRPEVLTHVALNQNPSMTLPIGYAGIQKKQILNGDTCSMPAAPFSFGLSNLMINSTGSNLQWEGWGWRGRRPSLQSRNPHIANKNLQDKPAPALREYLILYHHAKNCSTKNRECELPLCIKMKKFLRHISLCNNTSCTCIGRKQLFSRFRQCSSYSCRICYPQRSELTEKFEAMATFDISQHMAPTVDNEWPHLNRMMMESPRIPVQKQQELIRRTNVLAVSKRKGCESEHEQTLSKHRKSGTTKASISEHVHQMINHEFFATVDGTTDGTKLHERKSPPEQCDVAAKFNGELSDAMEVAVAQLECENLQVLLEAAEVEPKKFCASLIYSFTLREIREHLSSLKSSVGQISPCASKTRCAENAAENKGMEKEMDEYTCSLCSQKNLLFESPAIYCSLCLKKIRQGAYYLIVKSENETDQQTFLCNICHKSRARVNRKFIPNSKVEKRVNLSETDNLVERWVQCGKCNERQHEICALVNLSRDEALDSYTCPICFMKEIESGGHEALLQRTFGAEDLPTTMLSDHIEQRLFRRLKEDRQERANSSGKNFYEVPAAEGLVVRVVSSFVKKVEVKQEFQDIFQEEKYPSELPYKSKAILLFQKIDGADVLLFVMYVQEYGSECPFPNKGRVCISYIDSVNYFKPKILAASEEPLRTFVYQEIMIGYLDYCKKRGFASCYIWSCPPSKGEDYILYCHPKHQKVPNCDKLRGWYRKMFKKAEKEEIVLEITNLYDEFFVEHNEAKVEPTAGRLPYFDNDFWPREAEAIIKNQDESKPRKEAETRHLKVLRRASSVENHKDAELMFKLGESVLRMKDDLMMVHLQRPCKHCCRPVLSGNRWVCSIRKNFQLCEECFLKEQSLEEKDRNSVSARVKHSFLKVEAEHVLSMVDGDETMQSAILDTRLSLLEFCKKSHFQFDDLRKAKHSSMMILYYLRNPGAPASHHIDGG